MLESKTKRLRKINEEATRIAEDFKSKEAELIRILQIVETQKAFVFAGYRSLFRYTVDYLGLSENSAYNYITVSRKAQEVPQLLEFVEGKFITVSKARKIASVITSDNQALWLEKAKELSQKQLEKEVAKVQPLSSVQTKMSYVDEGTLEMTLPIDEGTLLSLKKAQDLLSQKNRKAVTLSETISHLTSDWVLRNDPVEKAKRAEKRWQKRKEVLENAEILEPKGNEDLGSMEGPESLLGIQNLESTENLKCKQNLESTRNLGAIRNLKSTQSFGAIQNLENPQNLENINSAKGSGKTQVLDKSMPPKCLRSDLLMVSRRIGRPTLSARARHGVNLRDRFQCTHLDENGKRCEDRRWIDIHHIHPVFLGGTDELENLQTLCAFHHRRTHQTGKKAER